MNVVPSDQAPMPENAKSKDTWNTNISARDLFSALDEAPHGHLAKSLASMNIPDLRVVSSRGARVLYSRDQADVPDMLKSVMFESLPDAVVQPFTVEALQQLMRFASSNNVPVIVRGAGSSPFGGSMPVAGGLVLDMNTLDRLLDFDPAAKTVKVQAGMRWADLGWFLEKKGLSLRSSPSSWFSTVGGWAAAGGIGICSVSAGRLIESVASIEVVTAKGELRTLTSSDPLFHSLFGSEGQVAVIVSVTLMLKPRSPSPHPKLVFLPDHASAIDLAIKLATADKKPMDLAYYSPAKFKRLNQLTHRGDFPEAHGLLITYESATDPAIEATPLPKTIKAAPSYLAHLMWNERYFPMKSRKLGPGLMGSEVLAPKEALARVVGKALDVCEQHGIEPMLEIHFLGNGDGMLLTYYITNQARQLKYTMDSFRGLLISKALYDVGAKPYSYGVWNHSFLDQADPDEIEELANAKKALDPQNIMNRGKYPRLGGKLGGLPAAFFSPGVLGSVLRAVNVMGPISASGIKIVASGGIMVRESGDPLLKAADECAMCGACVGVCPAYLITKDERVTARGKLLTARQMVSGGVSPEHAHLTSLCMRCKACEQVCQSKLSLVPLYEELEKRLADQHGRDDEQVKRFIETAEKSVHYDALIEKGLVLGAAGKNVEGGA